VAEPFVVLSWIKAIPVALMHPVNATSRCRDGQAGSRCQQHQSPTRGALFIVVDDDPAVRDSLKFSLEIEGFAVRAYAGGSAVLNDSDLECCQCLVVDQNMPEMSGLELSRRLRNRHVHAPVILITSHPTAALSTSAAGAGIPIVEKPLLGNALLDKINDAVAQHSRPETR